MPLAVLLLEDEALIALDIESELEEAGFTSVTLSSSAQALEWLASTRPEVAVLDINLIDGPCHVVVDILVKQRVPFIVHSGSFEPDYRDSSFSQGIWLSKPTPPGDLIALVNRVIANSL